MVSTIAPLVQVAKRQWISSTTYFMAASLAVGGLVGLVLGVLGAPALGALTTAARLWLLGILAVLLALVESGFVPLPVPTLHGSVSQAWWRRHGPRAALYYGAVLGAGIVTFNPFAAFYLVLAGALVMGPLWGLVIGASYGLGRALPILIGSVAVIRGVRVEDVGTWAIGPRRVLAKQISVVVLVSYACAAIFALTIRVR